MSLIPQLGDGYYDDEGNWQRTKFCFVQCQHCTCQPPGLLFYSVAHDKRKPLADASQFDAPPKRSVASIDREGIYSSYCQCPECKAFRATRFEGASPEFIAAQEKREQALMEKVATDLGLPSPRWIHSPEAVRASPAGAFNETEAKP
jgi:hypothetical protein